MNPDFSTFTLALFKEGIIIYSLDGPGIKPLAQCVLDLKGKEYGCTLHDKVIGLAAARLAVWSGIVNEIAAGTMSRPAREYLYSLEFPHTAYVMVPMILNRDKSDICPMEAIAQSTPSDEDMWEKIRERLKI